MQDEDSEDDDKGFEEAELENDDSEETDDSGVIYQVSTSGADIDIDGLIKRVKKGTIYRPKWQRSFVWTNKKASRFVESILLGLPIPAIFLFRPSDSPKLLIVDGLQRLSTLVAFRDGRLPGSKRVFVLEGLKSRFDGMSFEDLDEDDVTRFEDSIIHAFIVQQTAPEEDSSSAYHIFDRLNSTGTPAQPQEIRSAIYQGPFQDLIVSLRDVDGWKKIFGAHHKRGKDQELILRFAALLHSSDDYRKPMAEFLNRFMAAHRNSGEAWLKKFRKTFVNTCARAVEALGERPFRPDRALNVALYDAMMVGIARNPNATPQEIRKAYKALLKDPTFLSEISRATSDDNVVTGRIKKAVGAINAST